VEIYSSLHLFVLDKTNVSSLLAEALAADIQTVFSDNTVVVAANSAFARTLAVILGMAVPNSVVTHLRWRRTVVRQRKAREGAVACDYLEAPIPAGAKRNDGQKFTWVDSMWGDSLGLAAGWTY